MFQIACDTGGTFNDIVCIDIDDGVPIIIKTPSTPKDPSLAFLEGLGKLSQKLEMSLEQLLKQTGRIIYGTTVATNTILTRTGAITGIITTEGFRDVLIQNREHKPRNRFDPSDPPPPEQWMIAPRYLTGEVEERVKYDGSVYKPLVEESVTNAVRMLKERGAESVAVCYLFSFVNQQHEYRTREIINQEWPEASVSLSCEILPEIREFNRISTTVLNAYIQPRVYDYLLLLEKRLRESGYEQPLLIAICNGGVARADKVAGNAILSINSGPSAGPTSGQFYGGMHGWNNVITVDMGGTSFDVATITEGKIRISRESEIADLVYCIPSVDVYTIGAGGGSIAWHDIAGVLRVGPQSAGADPGPACYGKGGEEPTVTDADLVLGYLNPDYFLGGEMKLYPDLAEKAIKEKLADPLSMSVTEAAAAINRIVNSKMADGIRMVTVRRGEDPRQYVLATAGGAGPNHAVRLAQEIQISRVMIPRQSSVFCSIGMLSTDLRHDFTRTYMSRTEDADPDAINRLYEEMEEEAHRMLGEEGVEERDREFHRSAEVRYQGQIHEVEADVPGGPLSRDSLKAMEDAFHDKHETLYSYKEEDSPTEIQSLRMVAFGKLRRPSPVRQESATDDVSTALKTNRKVYFEEHGDYIETPVYDELGLKYGHTIEGPAIIEPATTTLLLPPKTKLEVDEFGNYIVTI